MLAIVSEETTEEATTMASIPGQDLQREFLALTRKSQEAALRAVKLSTPEEALADAFRFAEHLLAAQRKFAEDILKATVPLLQGGKDPAPEGAAAPESADAS
jgi:hypothetical protein